MPSMAFRALYLSKSSTTNNLRIVNKLIPVCSPTRLTASPFSQWSVYVLKNGTTRFQAPALYPYVIKGSRSPHFFEQDNEGFRFRVDLPGVKKDGLKLWVEDHTIHFLAKEAKDDDDKELFCWADARKIQGTVPLPQSYKHRAKELKAVLRHGVLKCMVPAARTN